MAQRVIGEDAGDHGFAHGHGANADARVVAALGHDLRFVAVGIYRLART